MNIGDGKKEPGDGGCFGSSGKFPSDTINTSAASVQITNDGGRTELSVSEDIREGSTHTSAVNRSYGSSKNNVNKQDDHPSSCTKELIQSDSVMEKTEKNAVAQTPPRDHDDSVNGKNRKEVSVNTVQHNVKANDGLPSQECDKMTNNVKISGDMDFSLDDAFGKMSSFKMDMPDDDFPKSPNKSTKLVENSEEVSSRGKHQDKFTYTFDSDGMNTSDGKNEHGHGGSLGSAKLPSADVNTFETSDPKAMSSIARSSVEMQKPVSKVSSTKHDSGPTSAKSTLLKNKVPGAINSKFPAVQPTNEGDRAEFSASEGNGEGTTHTGAVNRSVSVSCSYSSSKHNVKELNDRSSSFTKESIQSDSVKEKSEKDAAAHTPRDHDDTVNGEERNEASVDTVTQNGEAANDGLPSLECEKMTSNVKSSGFKIPLSTPPEQGTKFGHQRQGNLKDKISSIALTHIGQGNKLSSQRIDKKTFALPSLKITRRTTTDKHPAAPIMLSNAKSLGSVAKSTGPQAMIKMVSPTISVKQTPTPSLKRKPSEAADMGPPKLHTPKRFSPNESRVSKVSVREPEDGVQTQVNSVVGSTKNVSQENKTPKFHFDQEANMAALQFSLMVENDANVEKAEACAKELDNICNMLKKKHEEAKELLVRALVNNNSLLMLNHPINEEKISAVQRLASKLMSKELEVEA